MIRATFVRSALVLASGAGLALFGAPHERSASASAPNRAAVVVDLGDGRVRVGCVSFSEDHISGLEALERAAMAPVTQSYSGQGSAVCALCGKGCAAGSSCLTCQAPNYWAYYHRGAYSPASAGRTKVRNGDTEAWRWGTGERPANVSFDRVCPPAGSTSTSDPTAPSTTAAAPTRPPNLAPTVTPAPSPPGGGGVIPVNPNRDRFGAPALPTVPGAPERDRRTGAPASPTTGTPPKAGPATSGTTEPAGSSTTEPDGARKDGPGASEDASSNRNRRRVVIERAGAQRNGSTGRGGGGGSGAAVSIAGFMAAMTAVGGLIIMIRRRRAGVLR